MNYFGLFLSYFSLFVLGLADNVRGPIFPEIISEFMLSQRVGSLYFAATSFMGIVGGLASGYWLKRWSLKSSLQGSLFFMSVSFFIMALTSSYPVLLLAAALFGVSLGVLGVSQNVLALASTEEHHRQRAQAGLHSMYGAASLLSPLIFQYGINHYSSWRFSVGVCAAVMFLSFLATLLPKALPAQGSSEHTEAAGTITKNQELYFAVILSSYVLCELLVSSRLALYLRSAVGLETSESSFAVTLFFVLMFSGRLLFVFWQPKAQLKTQLIMSLLLTVLSLSFGILVHWSGLILAGLTMSPFYPLAMTAISRLFPHTIGRATSYAIAGTGIFVVFMHLVFGFVADFLGLRAALWMAPLFAIIALVHLCLFPRIFSKRLP